MGQYERYARDRGLLREIGLVLRDQPADAPSSIPRELALGAVAAWDRDEEEQLADPETDAQSADRDAAATLALVGLTLQSTANLGEDPVVVELGPELVASSVALTTT